MLLMPENSTKHYYIIACRSYSCKHC